MEALGLVGIESLPLLALGLLVEILDVLLQSNHGPVVIVEQVLRFMMIKVDVLTHYLYGCCHSDINWAIHFGCHHLKTSGINKILCIRRHLLVMHTSILMRLKLMIVVRVHSVTSICGHRNSLL